MWTCSWTWPRTSRGWRSPCCGGPSAGPATGRSQVRARGLTNVRIIRGRIADIHQLYGRFHFVVAPFRSVGKPCPNSILEGLACGRPALVSRFIDVADLLAREGAAVAFEPTAEGIVAAFHALSDRYEALQRNARACAERHFDLEHTVASYAAIYRRVGAGRRAGDVTDAVPGLACRELGG